MEPGATAFTSRPHPGPMKTESGRRAH